MQLVAPEEAGLDGARLEQAWQVIVDGLERGAYAGAVALIARRGGVGLLRATGRAVREPTCIPMRPDAIFDLASLTKVVATLPAILRLLGRGELALEATVGRFLPELARSGDKGRISIRHLLSHTSGLPAWEPLYLEKRGPDAYVGAIARLDLLAPPGERVVYSDLGYILLGEIVQRVAGKDLARFAAEEIFRPLGMPDTGFRPPSGKRSRIAATERGNATEMEMCGERGAGFGQWRRDLIWGEVNDGNAHYGLRGVAGHAGLFGTAADLARYGQLWLQHGAWDGRQILDRPALREALQKQGADRGLGWVLLPCATEERGAYSGRGLSAGSYGHTGFTGTSLWVDPLRELVVVLLTNRLHPEKRPEVEAVRPAFHLAVAAAVQGR